MCSTGVCTVVIRYNVFGLYEFIVYCVWALNAFIFNNDDYIFNEMHLPDQTQIRISGGLGFKIIRTIWRAIRQTICFMFFCHTEPTTDSVMLKDERQNVGPLNLPNHKLYVMSMIQVLLGSFVARRSILLSPLISSHLSTVDLILRT